MLRDRRGDVAIARERRRPSAGRNVPVSYTHLDVYKRQALAHDGLIVNIHTDIVNDR